MTVAIVDYGVGNVGSLTNMFDHIGVETCVVSTASEIAAADKLMLPGIGAFDTAMRNLRSRDLIGALNHAVLDRKRPVLGVCLGMQLLANDSEEGQEKGLGWIDASILRIRPSQPALKVPHMGWSELHTANPTPLFPEKTDGERFYFAHSYYMSCRQKTDIAATVRYGEDLCVAVARGNVLGLQFHPEKSHRFGMRALSTFARL
jgi:imidazole glycerol-phosphate synthase subunit HisH